MKYKYELLIDIDGVVRDLYTLVAKKLGVKNFEYKEGGVIFDIVKENPRILVDCKLTKYGKVIQRYIKKPIFLTYQKPSWRPQTREWLNKHFSEYEVFFVNSPKEKLEYFKQARYIIEDYPGYEDYSKIILIDAHYNRKIKHPFYRVKRGWDLESMLYWDNLRLRKKTYKKGKGVYYLCEKVK